MINDCLIRKAAEGSERGKILSSIPAFSGISEEKRVNPQSG
jgi:hypothetical protein